MIPDRLLEDAAERSRVSMATRWHRVRTSWRTMVQAGVAVMAAWAVAKWILGHPAPFFAPVAAVIALGTSYHERGRRAVELVVAVTIGIGAADLLAYQLGPGVAQLGLAVFLAIGIGMFFGTSQLFVNQVAVSAVLVFTVSTAGQGFSFARALDALTGGVIALVVAALIVPANPLRILRDAARAGARGARGDAPRRRHLAAHPRSGPGRGGAGAGARDRRPRRALLRRDPRVTRDGADLARA